MSEEGGGGERERGGGFEGVYANVYMYARVYPGVCHSFVDSRREDGALPSRAVTRMHEAATASHDSGRATQRVVLRRHADRTVVNAH